MTTSAQIVIDASISLKWALNDEEAVASAVALRDASLRGKFEMIAPSLWVYEVTNGLLFATRMQRLDPEQGLQALAWILTLGIRFADPPAEDIFSQAVKFSIAAYDAAYLALAEALDVSLWTGDRQFYNKTHPYIQRVCWIGDFIQTSV
jgi:predicted nucleic acid-binding protein